MPLSPHWFVSQQFILQNSYCVECGHVRGYRIKNIYFYTPSNFSAISPIPSLHLVTVQIYLHQPAIRTTSTEPCEPAAPLCSTHISPEAKISSSKATQSRGRMVVPFTLPMKKCPSHSTYSPLDTPSYRSPIKSPSQYFQICH